jgi:hypothetical protein
LRAGDFEVSQQIMKKILKEIFSSDFKRKAIIFQREDNSFSFEEQKFSEEPLELCWIPIGKYSISYFDNAVKAEQEAKSRIKWLEKE